ncbi:MAG: hypothetical protein EOO07_12580 [Chitinophagaceae bacterium]|nr:MAG: hypothetical protein EOO07_12580 [Chitinophagaceae bacterium]
MTEINRKIQSVDAKKTIIGNDRVHPNAPGHFVMAYQFLKSLQSPTYVSAIEIKNNKLKKVNNAEVTDFSSNNKSISFKLKEKALPFPMPLEASKALEFVPFIEEFNMQLLKVSPLADGDYVLNIDGILAGNFSSVQLEKGINLAMLKTTPQYKQALLVAQKANSYKNVQRKLRDIKFVEYSYFPKRLWNADLPTLKLFIDSTLNSLKTTNERKFKSLKPQFETYINDKPQQANFEKKADSLPDQIYAENKPGTYHYQIIKVARP